jgi:hypothetical protein
MKRAFNEADDELLAELRDEAQRCRPAFSAALHERLRQAVRSESRRRSPALWA